MKGRKAKAVIAGLVVLCLVSMSLLGIIWHREGYTRKVLIKLGLTTEKDPTRDHNALAGLASQPGEHELQGRRGFLWGFHHQK